MEDDDDPLPLQNGDIPPDGSDPASQVLALQDGQVNDQGSEVLAIENGQVAIEDGQVNDEGREVLAIKDVQVKDQASESQALATEGESKDPAKEVKKTWQSLRELSISGPNEDVRQRAHQIRAELIRPGQGETQVFSFFSGTKVCPS